MREGRVNVSVSVQIGQNSPRSHDSRRSAWLPRRARTSLQICFDLEAALLFFQEAFVSCWVRPCMAVHRLLYVSL